MKTKPKIQRQPNIQIQKDLNQDTARDINRFDGMKGHVVAHRC